jgi:hypothetical protein
MVQKIVKIERSVNTESIGILKDHRCFLSPAKMIKTTQFKIPTGPFLTHLTPSWVSQRMSSKIMGDIHSEKTDL